MPPAILYRSDHDVIVTEISCDRYLERASGCLPTMEKNELVTMRYDHIGARPDALGSDRPPAVSRDGLRHASDKADAEWWVIAPLTPDECAGAAKLATFGMGRYQRFAPIFLGQGGVARMAVRSSASR